MPPGRYAKPPIVEAVIELRFGASITRETMDKFLREVKSEYPTSEQNYEVTVELEVTGGAKQPSVKSHEKFQGYKLTAAKDAGNIILLGADRLATVRLAPYFGWDQFIGNAKGNFESLKKVVGYRNFTRIATRYVNRVDFPKRPNELIDISDYVVTGPRFPEIIPKPEAFSTQFTGRVPNIEGRVNVNVGPVSPSPLIDHFSILLDIDLFKDEKLPQKETEIWELMATLHDQKNALFEAFITDRARELFDRA